MEIATPSILTSLRNLIAVDCVTKVVCVPYFLSPGRHATIDVPNLIAEAKAVLDQEGVTTLDGNERIEVIVSDALGTHTESMLGAVDILVDFALNKQKA
jgi:sirohydrochlorin ferrochelatase